MCLYPKLIKNRKYVPNKKNQGNPPLVLDERTRYVPIGCQNCIECRKLKAREWQARLTEDIKHNINGKFVTLTFSNEQIKNITEGKDIDGNKIYNTKTKEYKKPLTSEGYELDNEIATIAVKGFLERWRKQFGKSIRHWLTTELGHNGSENIHLHGIVWTNEEEYTIKKIWAYGFIWIGEYVNTRTVNYIIKYVTKVDEIHKLYKSKILTSAGIGSGYENTSNGKTNKYNKEKTEETYRTTTGQKIGLPIYWRNKIYSEEEREKLWIQKIEKEERYILGHKISTKKGYDLYNKLLTVAQAKNKRLGYGSDERNWTQEQYEIERRNMKNDQRRAQAYANHNNGSISAP